MFYWPSMFSSFNKNTLNSEKSSHSNPTWETKTIKIVFSRCLNESSLTQSQANPLGMSHTGVPPDLGNGKTRLKPESVIWTTTNRYVYGKCWWFIQKLSNGLLLFEWSKWRNDWNVWMKDGSKWHECFNNNRHMLQNTCFASTNITQFLLIGPHPEGKTAKRQNFSWWFKMKCPHSVKVTVTHDDEKTRVDTQNNGMN